MQIKNDTYLVIKREWLSQRLTPKEMYMFDFLVDKILSKRPAHSYYICNVDEPYADEVFNVILKGERERTK